jgi:hypothetical protein
MDWWTPEQGGMIGAMLGAGVGVLLGGIGGGVCAPLAVRGKAKRFVFAFLGAITVMGAALLVGSVVAMAVGQPYHVWYPILLPGVLSAPLGSFMLWIMRRSYRQHDERRLAAEELRRG